MTRAAFLLTDDGLGTERIAAETLRGAILQHANRGRRSVFRRTTHRHGDVEVLGIAGRLTPQSVLASAMTAIGRLCLSDEIALTNRHTFDPKRIQICSTAWQNNEPIPADRLVYNGVSEKK